jgi:hypothetical protein
MTKKPLCRAPYPLYSETAVFVTTVSGRLLLLRILEPPKSHAGCVSRVWAGVDPRGHGGAHAEWCALLYMVVQAAKRARWRSGKFLTLAPRWRGSRGGLGRRLVRGVGGAHHPAVRHPRRPQREVDESISGLDVEMLRHLCAVVLWDVSTEPVVAPPGLMGSGASVSCT